VRLLVILLVAGLMGCTTLNRTTTFIDAAGTVHETPVSISEQRSSFIQLDPQSANAMVRDGTGGAIRIGIPGSDLDIVSFKFGMSSDASIPRGQEASICQGIKTGAAGTDMLADRCLEIGDLYDHENHERPAALTGLTGLPNVPVTSLDTLTNVPNNHER